MDPWLHLVLFLLVALVVVVMGAFYNEADDRRALESLPRRFLVFVLGCAILAGLLLLAEHTLAAV